MGGNWGDWEALEVNWSGVGRELRTLEGSGGHWEGPRRLGGTGMVLGGLGVCYREHWGELGAAVLHWE